MIQVQLRGRMGNNMFQYAVVRTVAEMRGYDFALKESNDWQWRWGKLFNVDRGVKCGVIKKTFFDTNQQEFNPDIFNVEDFTLLYGFFQSEKYFDHEKVRTWFKPIVEIPPVPDDVCYIHFRGGDYNEFPWSLYQLPNSYYADAKEKILEQNGDIRFIVVTDDVMEARNRFPNDEIISCSMEVDFTTMTKAKYLIISNSTYSWWAAWLSNAYVIAPQGWNLYNSNKDVFSPADIKVERFIWT